jgi:sodium transport system permease protein
MFSVILLSTTVTAGLLLTLCRWWFNREQVLFRN